MDSKLSVIIPCYNAEKWLINCLDTVQNQTLKEVEIICIDDKSTDNTLKILKRIAEQDDRVIVVAKDLNDGAGASRNIGIKLAKGEFISFIDPDDYYPKNDVLEILYKKAFINNVEICGGNIVGIDEFGNKKDIPLERYYFDSFQNYYSKPFAYGYTRYIYKRKFLLDNKVLFPDFVRFQDPPFLVRAMALAKKFYSIHMDVYVYRTNYKKINWTEKKALDNFKGIKAVLDLSRIYKLDKLYTDFFLGTLFSKWSYEIYLQNYSSVRLKKLLLQIFKNANFELLDNKVNHILNPLEEYVKLVKKDNTVWKHYKNYFIGDIETRENYIKVLNRIRKKHNHINVIFIVSENQKWTYQDLYNIFEKDNRFYPLVLISLLKAVHDNIDDTRNNLEENYNFFKSRGMNVKYCYVDGEYLSLKKFNPDMVFYEQPWELPDFYQPRIVSKFALTFFENYFYSGLFDIDVNSLTSDFHKNLYKFFLPNYEIKNDLIRKVKEFENICVVIGFSKLDRYLDAFLPPKNIWAKRNLYRIIYAPHHSLDSDYKLSTFKKNGLFLLELAKKHPETTWLFKPHPRLKFALKSLNIMSQKEIDDYYNEWKKIGNVYTYGDYIDIFRDSDLLITDCCSFLGEYLFTEKPVIRLCNQDSCRLTPFGEELTRGYYQIYDNCEIEPVLNKLISRDDEKLECRKKISKKLLEREEKTSNRIYKYILDLLRLD